MIRTLRVVTWNANGLTERRPEFQLFLETEKIDIALISETRFTAKSHVIFKNYTTYTTNHPSGNSHGGTAVIIRNNIKHYALEEYKTDKLQATSVKVIFNDQIETTLSSVYCPPRHSITEGDFNLYFSSLGSRFISGGDWNSKHTYWSSRLITHRGTQLYKSIQRNKYQCMTTHKPTHWPSDRNKIPDLLDFFVTNNINPNYMTIENCTDLSSDHTPVILNINSTVVLSEPMERIHNKFTNWQLYQDTISTNLKLTGFMKTSEEIETAIENLNTNIHLACDASTKRFKRWSRPNQYPKAVKDKITERRRLRKIWHQTRYPRDKTAFNRCSVELKCLIKTTNDTNVQRFLSNLTASSDTNYSLWRATKKIKRPINQIPPIKKTNSEWARSDSEKATTFAEHLSTVFQPFPLMCSQQDHEVTTYLQSPYQMSLPIRHTTPNEIMAEIRQLKDGKSPGYDQIDSTLLKNLPKKGVIAITNIFNACLRTSCFPGQWKIAQVVMLVKPGKPPYDVTSYRPISLLPILSKIFEKILLKRMKEHMNDIIPTHQFGFRENHGTVEQVHRLVDVISRSLEEKQYCSAVFLDISQAFDKVWHKGLLYKIKQMLPHSYFLILKSYLSDRCFEVKFNTEHSDLYKINSGVPQGSVLGPVLYTIYTADLPTMPNTMTATYADDTAILATHIDPTTASEILQCHLKKIEEWLKIWRIKANQSKSKHVTFTLRRQTCPPVLLNQEEIPQDDNAKYLGMHLDRRLTWRKHVWTKRKQLDAKLRELYWLIGRYSQLGNECKITVYKAILKPIWTYGIQLWGTTSNSNIEILERFQTKTIRNIFNIPQWISNRLIYQDINLRTIKQEIAQYSQKYQKRLTNHKNDLAHELSGQGSLQYQRLKRHGVPGLANRFNNRN